jgi:hypothetical protein
MVWLQQCRQKSNLLQGEESWPNCCASEALQATIKSHSWLDAQERRIFFSVEGGCKNNQFGSQQQHRCERIHFGQFRKR